jgi:hypothetical protein
MIAGKLAIRLALLERTRRVAALNDPAASCDCVLRIRVCYVDEDLGTPAPPPMQPAAAAHCPHGRPWSRVAVLYADADEEGDDDE